MSLQSKNESYIGSNHLRGMMIDFGTYTFLYTPPLAQSLVGSTRGLHIRSDANLEDMLHVFAEFLRGAGYSLSPSSRLEVVDIADPLEN